MSYAVDQRAEMVYAMVKKDPNLLNPAVSNRFVFAKSKSILVEKLGSESAAIGVMKQFPGVLREGDDLVEQSAGQIKSKAAAKSAAPIVFAAIIASAALVAANQELQLGLNLPVAGFPQL